MILIVTQCTLVSTRETRGKLAIEVRHCEVLGTYGTRSEIDRLEIMVKTRQRARLEAARRSLAQSEASESSDQDRHDVKTGQDEEKVKFCID